MVSIIIPCYKKAQYLSATLDSVLNQAYSNWECIIVDDGSPDNTSVIAADYCIKDSRFKYLYQDNAGVSAARNKGILASVGKYVLPLDADDLISVDYVAKAVEYLESHQECKLVYPMVQFFGTVNGLFELPDYSYEEELWKNLIVCSAVYRRQDYDETDGYNENMKTGYEDWDFWLTFLKQNDIVKRLDFVGLYYRQLNESRNLEAICMNDELCRQIVANHHKLYEPYFDSIINFHEEARFYKDELKRVKSSMAYRLGEAISKPYRKIRYRN